MDDPLLLGKGREGERSAGCPSYQSCEHMGYFKLTAYGRKYLVKRYACRIFLLSLFNDSI